MAVENVVMRPCTTSLISIIALGLIASSGTFDLARKSALAASTIYYCPDRKSDQQYSANQGPGCVPLVQEKQREGNDDADGTGRHDLKKEDLERNVSAFLEKYRRFLDCCKTDFGELREIEELAEEVNELLASEQASLSNYSLASRGIMLKEMILPVAKARADLKTLRTRLERINELSGRRQSQGFEEAARDANTIQELEESIDRDVQASTPAGSAKTGAEIGVAPAAGPRIGRSPKTGIDIGREGLTGQEIGVSPRNSRDIGGSGPTGFEIGATGRAGAAIGDSPLNHESSSNVSSSFQRSSVGSSIGDSSVGSSIGASNVGSTLQDSNVGSSFGGSSVGSTLQSR